MRHSFAFVAVAATSSLASAQVVFSNNFEGAMPAEITGAGSIQGSQGYSGWGFGNNLLRNDAGGNPATATTLTLTGLGAHTSISIDCLLAVIDSWDSDNGNPSPDYFNIAVDGSPVFQATFAHASGGNNYNLGQLVYNTQLGFNGSWGDSAYDLSFEPSLHNIAHTGSTLTITFFASGGGWQAGDDESWGIDNLTVTLVPTPGAATLLLAGAPLAMRRRRS
ncbi:MAG: hypothetical protein QM783_19280 [Phycisphaerales bacterium]